MPTGMADVLFAERRRLGWSRAKLAKVAKVDKSTIYRIETSRSSPDSATTAALDAAMGLHGLLVSAAALTSGVKPADDTRHGEIKPEASIMDRLNDDAVTLGIQFMRVPEEERDAVFSEALALFRRRARPRPPRGEDHAEGDL